MQMNGSWARRFTGVCIEQEAVVQGSTKESSSPAPSQILNQSDQITGPSSASIDSLTKP
jgi:hypothetical protein